MRARSKPKSSLDSPQTLRIIGGKWRGLKLLMPESSERDSRVDSTRESAAKAPARSCAKLPAKTPAKSPIKALANASPKDLATTRPTKSIVRESFFNTLAGEMYGACFIEGFAGSGSMGIEALSRGASVGVFCEQDSHALQILAHNLSLLPIATHHELGSLDLAPANSRALESRISKASSLDSITQGPIDSALDSRALLHVDSAPSAYILRGDSFAHLPHVFAWLESSALQGALTHGILYLDPPFCIRENYADIYEKCANLIDSIVAPSLRHIIIEHSSAQGFADRIGGFALRRSRRFGKSTLTYFTQGV